MSDNLQVPQNVTPMSTHTDYSKIYSDQELDKVDTVAYV